MKFGLLKDWRILFVIVALIAAIIMINPSLQRGVVITSVDTTSPLYGLVQVGETFDWANEKAIEDVADLYEFESYTGVFRFMHSGKLDLVNIDDPGLGIGVSEQPLTNLQFGMDLVGGTRVLLEPMEENVTEDVMQQTLTTLETRINTYGLKEAKFQEVEDISGNKYIQIEMAGGSKKEVDELLAKQGHFEAKIPMIVVFEDKTGTLKLGDNEYSVEYRNTSVKLGDEIYYINRTFELDGIDFKLENFTSDGVLFVASVFKGDDITSVCMQDNPGICTSRLFQQSDGWEFMFQVFISQEGAERFAKVTKNMKSFVDPNSGEAHLESRIYLFLDDVEITNLAISSDLAGKAYTQPMITGFRENQEEAMKEKLKLQSILQSGALPVQLRTVKVDQISPSLGTEFMKAGIITAIIALVAVSSVIFIRYRSIKILIPMVLFSIFELTLVLGAAAMIKWTIDLASIAGIIAAIGTGTNDQIMMIDEIIMGGGHEKIYTIKQKVKRAFFIIFGAAATIIAAMLPLMFIGIGVMKGFAITTTLGILIGVFITRPAFAKIAEKILEK